jgi:hypothetical protein
MRNILNKMESFASCLKVSLRSPRLSVCRGVTAHTRIEPKRGRSMEARAFISQRTETKRYLLKGFLPGRLMDATGQLQIQARPIDVSRRGLGLIINQAIQIGTHVWFQFDDKKIKLELAYCHSHLGIDNAFKCGFFTKDPDLSLEELFLRKGLINPNEFVTDSNGI